ncbi:terminase small subunit [Paracoccus sp. (in: a-proteobacteria)]|uniref:terminase small subunit n=1 Tax=Paracoccus sp. TaxID=267 RepID=UPI0028AAE029|nr:terminase small subunit [Paracoccus sp. (in: a-proteobacteria)]
MSELLTLADGSVLDVARYPLPDGVVDDGTPLNRAQLAAAFSVSVNAVTDWVNKGMPVMVTGQNGVAYEFRLAHCWAWRQDRDDRTRAAKLRGDQLAAQAALAFRNLDDDQAEEEADLTADDLRKWSEAEYHRNRVAEQRGDLLRADRTRVLIEDLLVSFGTAMDNLPDFAEMNFGLTPAQVAQMQDYCDEVRGEARRLIEERIGRGGAVVALPGSQSEMELA